MQECYNRSFSSKDDWDVSCLWNMQQNVFRKKHVRTNRSGKAQVCEACDKPFLRKNYLNEHLQIHTGQKLNVYAVWNKLFSQKSLLYKHIRTHTDEKPYFCKACNKRFLEKCSLDLLIPRGEKPHICDM